MPLSRSATAGDWIHDFRASDAPQFRGKSPAERQRMALGAYYAKQRERARGGIVPHFADGGFAAGLFGGTAGQQQQTPQATPFTNLLSATGSRPGVLPVMPPPPQPMNGPTNTNAIPAPLPGDWGSQMRGLLPTGMATARARGGAVPRFADGGLFDQGLFGGGGGGTQQAQQTQTPSIPPHVPGAQMPGADFGIAQNILQNPIISRPMGANPVIDPSIQNLLNQGIWPTMLKPGGLLGWQLSPNAYQTPTFNLDRGTPPLDYTGQPVVPLDYSGNPTPGSWRDGVFYPDYSQSSPYGTTNEGKPYYYYGSTPGQYPMDVWAKSSGMSNEALNAWAGPAYDYDFGRMAYQLSVLPGQGMDSLPSQGWNQPEQIPIDLPNTYWGALNPALNPYVQYSASTFSWDDPANQYLLHPPEGYYYGDDGKLRSNADLIGMPPPPPPPAPVETPFTWAGSALGSIDAPLGPFGTTPTTTPTTPTTPAEPTATGTAGSKRGGDVSASGRGPAGEPSDPAQFVPIAQGGIVTGPGRYQFGGALPPVKQPHLIKSTTPGRTDRIRTKATPGSFVIPAHVVSGLGQGNTDAGAKIIGEIVKTGPYGTQAAKMSRAKTLGPMGKMPSMSSMGGSARIPGMMRMHSAGLHLPRMDRARGGEVDDEPTDIIAAGGEVVLPPDVVAAYGNGDPEQGKQVWSSFVKRETKRIGKEILKLPGPVA